MTDEITKTAPPSGESAVQNNSANQQVNYSTDATLYDYVTLYEAAYPINKQYFINDKGGIEKIKDKGNVFGSGWAIKKHVPTLESLVEVNQGISESPNKCIGLNFNPSIPVEIPYFVVSQDKRDEQLESGLLIKKEGVDNLYKATEKYAEINSSVVAGTLVTCRLKDYMTFSSYILFDKDEGDSDIDQWVKDMATFVPGFDKVDKIIIPSNSSRVGLNKSKFHVYVKIADAMDIALDLKGRLRSAGNAKGHVVDKNPNGDLSKIITDLTVFSPERVIFDGKPIIKGSDDQSRIEPVIATVTKDSIRAIDTSLVKTVEGYGEFKTKTITTLGADGKQHKQTIRKCSGAFNCTKLKWDSPIPMMQLGKEKNVIKTMRQVVDEKLIEIFGGKACKLKCQSTFDDRNSTSWNGIISYGSDGLPHLYDNGDEITYKIGMTTAQIFGNVKGFTSGGKPVPESEWAWGANGNTVSADTGAEVVSGEFEAGLTTQITALDEDSTPDEINTVLTLLYGVDDQVTLEKNLKKITEATGITKTALKSNLKELRPTESFETESITTMLINIGNSHVLFHDDNKDGYADCRIRGIKCTVKIKSEEYKNILRLIFYKKTGNGVSKGNISDAVSTLDALAQHEGKLEVVAVRTHKMDEAVYIDLGDEQRTILEVNKKGWGIVEDAPVWFIRKTGMTALPVPVSDDKGDLHLLKKHINIKDEDYPLVYGFMLCALAGVTPYPILVINGEEGTAKSFNATVIRALVDPNSTPLRGCPVKIDDLLVSVSHSHLGAIDNLSGITNQMSDALCMLSTGGGMDKRRLNTDDDLHLVNIQKPVMLTGIDEISSRSDLLSRSFLLDLPFIPEHAKKDEVTCKAEFEKDKAIIFTGLLNAIVSGLKHYHSIELEQLPRMADAIKWVTGCEVDMGLKGALAKAHARNQANASANSIESSPVGSALLGLMKDGVVIECTPTELLGKLRLTHNVNSNNAFGQRHKWGDGFPRSTKGLSNKLKRLTPSFRKQGIIITKQDSGSRLYKITKMYSEGG